MMNRRHVLELASVGAVGGIAGCLEPLSSDTSDTATECDLTPFDRLDHGWSHANGTLSSSRRIGGGGFTIDDQLERRVLHEFDESPRVSPDLASPETLCCHIEQPGDDQVTSHMFVDIETGDELWRIDEYHESSPADLEPPDGTTAHGSTYVSPYAIAGGLVYVTAYYQTDAEKIRNETTLSVGLFALDATDGAVEWSRAGWPSRLHLGREGRLYATGYSDALIRADPADQRQDEAGEWTPEPGTDERLHAQALNARTGESCWERDVAPPAPDSNGFQTTWGHGVTGGQVLVTFVDYDVEQVPGGKTSLLRMDTETGDDHEAIEFMGPPLDRSLHADGRLILGNTSVVGPPTDDAPTDGATLFAIDLSQGEIDWMVPRPTDGRLGAATEDIVVCGGETIVGVDAATGETEWETDSSAEVTCIADETLVTYDSERLEIQTRELETGDVIARTPLEESAVPKDASGWQYHSRVIAADGQFFTIETTESETRLITLR